MNRITTQENTDRFFQTWNKITKVFASMEYYREDPSLTKIELLTLTIVSNKKEVVTNMEHCPHCGVINDTWLRIIIDSGDVGETN